MEVDGVQIGQSLAIARYLAKKAGIEGKTDVEQALADGIVDFVKDLLMGKSLWYYLVFLIFDTILTRQSIVLHFGHLLIFLRL